MPLNELDAPTKGGVKPETSDSASEKRGRGVAACGPAGVMGPRGRGLGLGLAAAPAPQQGAELGVKVETEWLFFRKPPLLGCCLLPTPSETTATGTSWASYL